MLIRHENKLYESEQRGPLTVWRESAQQVVEKAPAPFLDYGARMPYELWRTALAFMRWGYETQKSEVMVYFMWNKDTFEWALFAPEQTLKGMSVDVPKDSEINRKEREKWGKGWIQFGSLHHHCGMSAFASGTDKDDEAKRDGFHVTIGNLDKPVTERSIHCRATMTGRTVEVHPTAFLQYAHWFAATPEECRTEKLYTVQYLFEEHAFPFPKEWETRCKKPVEVPREKGVAGNMLDLTGEGYVRPMNLSSVRGTSSFFEEKAEGPATVVSLDPLTGTTQVDATLLREKYVADLSPMKLLDYLRKHRETNPLLLEALEAVFRAIYPGMTTDLDWNQPVWLYLLHVKELVDAGIGANVGNALSRERAYTLSFLQKTANELLKGIPKPGHDEEQEVDVFGYVTLLDRDNWKDRVAVVMDTIVDMVCAELEV